MGSLLAALVGVIAFSAKSVMSKLDAQDTQQISNVQRISVLEARLTGMDRQLDRIENKLDKLGAK